MCNHSNDISVFFPFYDIILAELLLNDENDSSFSTFKYENCYPLSLFLPCSRDSLSMMILHPGRPTNEIHLIFMGRSHPVKRPCNEPGLITVDGKCSELFREPTDVGVELDTITDRNLLCPLKTQIFSVWT